MKANYIFLFFLIGFLYHSCKKDNQDEFLLDSFESSKVYAGVSDTSLFNYTFINPISIDITYDSNNLYGIGSKAIDFDLNGIDDLIIKMNIVNQDSIHLLNGYDPNPFPSCLVESNSSLSVAMVSQQVMSTTHYWCDTIVEGQEINSELEWSNINVQLDLWKETNGVNIGSWSLINGISYIGFKFNDKYGWLEVDATDPLNPIFTKFAMQR